MELFVDLHIHSALSPCADDDMTPANIINMAYLKGLDAVAITDHNCGLNVKAAKKAAEGRGLILVPGMEIQTREEFHSICLFRDFESFYKFSEYISFFMPRIDNREEIFGKQLVFNENDQVIKNHKIMLLNSVSLNFNQVYQRVFDLKGVVIPAHIDRDSYSIISSLGFIPEEYSLNTIEVRDMDKFKVMGDKVFNKKYRIIKSSDAHKLQDIQECIFKIEVKEKSLNGIINALI